MTKTFLLPTLLAFLFTIIFSYHSLYRHYTFNSHALDLGIHAQISYLFSRTFSPFSSILHMPYLADHFGLIMFFLSPLSRFFPSAATILILQAIFVAASSIFIYLIAFDKLKSILLSFFITLAYLTSPSLLSAIDFDFHLATISVLPLSLILFAWYFRKWKLYWAFLLLAILFKEDVEIFIFGIGAYTILQKQYQQGIATMLFAVLSFYLIKFQIMPFLWAGSENLDIGTSVLPLNDPLALAYLFFIRPNVFLDQMFNSPVKLATVDFVSRQFAFLSLLSPLSWFTVLPALFLRFSSTATHFWTSGFHYNANLTPLMSVSAILAIGKFKLSKYAVSFLLIFFLLTGGLSPFSMIWTTSSLSIKDANKFSYINDSIKNIPIDAAVSAQSPIVPHLTSREKIYMFPDIYDAQFIVLDNYLSSYPLQKNELYEKIDNLRKSSYWKIFKENNSLIIFKKAF